MGTVTNAKSDANNNKNRNGTACLCHVTRLDHPQTNMHVNLPDLHEDPGLDPERSGFCGKYWWGISSLLYLAYLFVVFGIFYWPSDPESPSAPEHT